MKRLWMLVLLMMSSLAVLAAPAFAKSGEGSDDSSETTMEDVNSSMGSISSKINDMEKVLGLKFFGDVRVRVDWRTQAQSDVTNLDSTGTKLLSGGPINDQVRPRYRARLGATKTVGDVTGTLRFVTGATNNPNSENQTFDAAFENPTINIDTAMIAWTPGFLQGHLKLAAGKMPNPLLISPISWDGDIQPEGFLAEVSNMATNTKLRVTYFDINNQNAGGAQLLGAPASLYLTGSNTDEFMANAQLEQLLQIDKDTSLTAMVGYEYIPNVTALAGGNVAFPPSGQISSVLNQALVGSDGNIWNYGGTIPDIQMLEAMLVINHKVGDVPLKWVLHATDNIDSFNIPASGNPVGTAAAMPVTGAYTNFTNQYSFYANVNIGQVKAKGDLAGFIGAGYVEPNAQLGFLVDDDRNYANREYLQENLTYGLEDNVQLILTAFDEWHVYYAYLGTPNNKLGGTSQLPEFITFFDCMASF